MQYSKAQLYWYDQLVGHQPEAIYLCVCVYVSLCVHGHATHDPILLSA